MNRSSYEEQSSRGRYKNQAVRDLGRAYREIHFQLNRFEENKKWNKDELKAEFDAHVGKIDVGKLYDTEKQRLQQIADSSDYSEVLKVFNRKGLANQIADKLGYKSDAYKSWFFGEVKTERRDKTAAGILEAIRKILPTIPAS